MDVAADLFQREIAVKIVVDLSDGPPYNAVITLFGDGRRLLGGIQPKVPAYERLQFEVIDGLYQIIRHALVHPISEMRMTMMFYTGAVMAIAPHT